MSATAEIVCQQCHADHDGAGHGCGTKNAEMRDNDKKSDHTQGQAMM